MQRPPDHIVAALLAAKAEEAKHHRRLQNCLPQHNHPSNRSHNNSANTVNRYLCLAQLKLKSTHRSQHQPCRSKRRKQQLQHTTITTDITIITTRI